MGKSKQTVISPYKHTHTHTLRALTLRYTYIPTSERKRKSCSEERTFALAIYEEEEEEEERRATYSERKEMRAVDISTTSRRGRNNSYFRTLSAGYIIYSRVFEDAAAAAAAISAGRPLAKCLFFLRCSMTCDRRAADRSFFGAILRCIRARARSFIHEFIYVYIYIVHLM